METLWMILSIGTVFFAFVIFILFTQVLDLTRRVNDLEAELKQIREEAENKLETLMERFG